MTGLQVLRRVSRDLYDWFAAYAANSMAEIRLIVRNRITAARQVFQGAESVANLSDVSGLLPRW